MVDADCFSFGGGVQSTACLVLAARGDIGFQAFVMADVGADSENPATVDYVRDVAAPYAAAHGLTVEVIHRQWRSGRYRSLLGYMDEIETSIPIPVHLAGGGPSNRLCTIRWKIEPVERWQRDRGATEAQPARLGIGISVDEIERARTASRFPTQTLTYPLIELGIDRAECARIVADAGLPPAPKSSCWFCPYQGTEQWRRRRRTEPEVFAAAVDLEYRLNARRAALGRDGAYLTRYKAPLDRVIDDQLVLFDDEPSGCTEGSCWT